MPGTSFSAQLLPAVEITADDTPTASVIWLHGLGADGHDFAPVVQAMQPLPHIRFILPHAPHMPVTLNGGYAMPAWYDLYGANLAAHQDEAGMLASRARIDAWIAQEVAHGIQPARILLAGFSQGGAIALLTGLLRPQRLAGVIALSTYLPLPEKLAHEAAPASRKTPIFMAHGLWDNIVPLRTGAASRARLEEIGHAVEWHEYAMPHAVCDEEIADIRAFILRALP